MEWQPIETCPIARQVLTTDGKECRALTRYSQTWASPYFIDIYWVPSVHDENGDEEFMPLMWMELPELPDVSR